MLKKLETVTELKAPALIDTFRTTDAIWILREYVSGITLIKAIEKNEFTIEEIVVTALKICEKVACLHKQDPPVIHRDIKPENIIIGKNGEVMLIDFETARLYRKNKKADTRLIGTKGIAAPEQYGFRQTDERTDIYGIGKTLLYMTTGTYELAELEKSNCYWPLRRIIYKCCAFNPKDRFQNIYQLRKQLSHLLYPQRKREKWKAV